MGFITKLDISTCCAFGSQMSQYATMVAVGKHNRLQPLFVQETLNQGFGFLIGTPFKHSPAVVSISELKNLPVNNFTVKQDENNLIDKELFSLSSNQNYLINGDIGLYSYFHNIRNELLKLYSFKDEINNFCLDYLKTHKRENETVVSICFRRGDYLTEASLNLSLEYYNEALKTIQNLLPNKKIKYFVFSGAAYGDDGMSWVKENFKLNNAVYVENLDRFQQMCLMSLCDHNIIANSSFPWWGAYLNQNENKKVICPYNYLDDHRFNYINGNYFPNEWIAIHQK
jgi:hypothetical protein